MALDIKTLAMGKVRNSGASSIDIYGPVAAGKATVVKSMVFVNARGAANQVLNVYFLKNGGGITKKMVGYIKYSAGGATSGTAGRYVITDEITMEAGDKLQADSGTTDDVVDFVLSGMERDA